MCIALLNRWLDPWSQVDFEDGQPHNCQISVVLLSVLCSLSVQFQTVFHYDFFFLVPKYFHTLNYKITMHTAGKRNTAFYIRIQPCTLMQCTSIQSWTLSCHYAMHCYTSLSCPPVLICTFSMSLSNETWHTVSFAFTWKDTWLYKMTQWILIIRSLPNWYHYQSFSYTVLSGIVF